MASMQLVDTLHLDTCQLCANMIVVQYFVALRINARDFHLAPRQMWSREEKETRQAPIMQDKSSRSSAWIIAG